MNKVILKINKFSDKDIQKYFETENINTLKNIKLYADDIYYNTGESSGLSDDQYDMLKEILRHRDPSYTAPIGAKLREGTNRTELPYWLGSMDKVKLEDTKVLDRWLKKNKSSEYIVQEKMDGVSCLFVYENKDIKLFTRGDGIIGADISYLAPYFFQTLNFDIEQTLVIRGELIIKKKIFEEMYALENSNPRNFVSGRIGAKIAREGLQEIDFIAYEIIANCSEQFKPSEQLEYLDELGFKTVRRQVVKKIDIDYLSSILVELKIQSEYEIDGIIIQSDKKYIRNISGNPDYAFAFKMMTADDIVEAEVVGVEWNVSKWGLLKPRVEIKPIELCGVNITYATGFNAKFIVDNCIGKGSIINIIRSGDVIPHIVKILKPSVKPDMPIIPYKWNQTNVDILTENDPKTMSIKLIHSFFSHLGIKHVGEKYILKMYEYGFDTLLKIIAASKKDLKSVPGFEKKLGEKIWDNIHFGLKKLSIPKVLGASGVFGNGLAQKKIVSLFENFPDILKVYKYMTKEQLLNRVESIDGFSEKLSIKIVKSIRAADMFLEELKNFATFREDIVCGDNLKDMKIVFSGFRDKKLEEDITSKSGNVVTSVSKNTSIVVTTNLEEKSSKVKKAEELGIKIISKDDFIKEYIR